MKGLIAVSIIVAVAGVATALGMRASIPQPPSVEFQPKPGFSASPRVMQDAQCTPTPTPTPGGHPKKPKAPETSPNK